MSFTIEYSKTKRSASNNCAYLIYGDGRLIAPYWHDFRGDEPGIEFLNGDRVDWTVGRAADFLEGGGPKPLVLSERAKAYLTKKQTSIPELARTEVVNRNDG